MSKKKKFVLRREKDNKSEVTYVRLTEDQRKWIEYHAKEQHMTTSEFIRVLIQEAKDCGVVFQS